MLRYCAICNERVEEETEMSKKIQLTNATSMGCNSETYDDDHG